MAKTPRTRKPTATQIAVVEDEMNQAMQMMVLETLDATTETAAEAVENLTQLSESETDIIAQLDAVDTAQAEAVSNVPATEQVEAVPVAQATAPTDASAWDKAMNDIAQDAIDQGVLSVAKAIDDRAAFETIKDSGNSSIQRTLKKARSQLATKAATKAMLACGFDEGQINRSKHQGARYNVYALGKLADILHAVAQDKNIGNAVNNAIMRSLFKMRRSAIPFTMEVAKAAVSDKIRVDGALKNLLVRHTVSASTAPTQASSTMQALVDLGVVSRSGPEKTPTFALTDAPIVAKLEAVLQAA